MFVGNVMKFLVTLRMVGPAFLAKRQHACLIRSDAWSSVIKFNYTHNLLLCARLTLASYHQWRTTVLREYGGEAVVPRRSRRGGRRNSLTKIFYD